MLYQYNYFLLTCSVGVIDIYDWDVRKIALQGLGGRLLRYMDYLMENITMQVFERQALGMNVTQWKVLGNADGFNLIEHGCPLCKWRHKYVILTRFLLSPNIFYISIDESNWT